MLIRIWSVEKNASHTGIRKQNCNQVLLWKSICWLCGGELAYKCKINTVWAFSRHPMFDAALMSLLEGMKWARGISIKPSMTCRWYLKVVTQLTETAPEKYRDFVINSTVSHQASVMKQVQQRCFIHLRNETEFWRRALQSVVWFWYHKIHYNMWHHIWLHVYENWSLSELQEEPEILLIYSCLIAISDNLPFIRQPVVNC